MAYTVRNTLDTEFDVSDISWVIQGLTTVGLLDEVTLTKVRASSIFLEALATGELVVYKDGIELEAPEAIIGIWGAFFVENPGNVDPVFIGDLGFTVQPETEYDLSLKPTFKMRNSPTLALKVATGELIANDGTRTLTKVEAIKRIFGITGGAGSGSGEAPKMVLIQDSNDISVSVFVYSDPNRDKWLSTDRVSFLYGEPVAQTNDWVLMSHGRIPHADLGYTVPMDMTITGIRMDNTEVKHADSEIFIYQNGNPVNPAVLTLSPGDNSVTDQTLDVDVDAGDLIRIRMGATPPGLRVSNLSVTLIGQWRWTETT